MTYIIERTPYEIDNDGTGDDFEEWPVSEHWAPSFDSLKLEIDQVSARKVCNLMGEARNLALKHEDPMIVIESWAVPAEIEVGGTDDYLGDNFCRGYSVVQVRASGLDDARARFVITNKYSEDKIASREFSQDEMLAIATNTKVSP